MLHADHFVIDTRHEEIPPVADIALRRVNARAKAGVPDAGSVSASCVRDLTGRRAADPAGTRPCTRVAKGAVSPLVRFSRQRTRLNEHGMQLRRRPDPSVFPAVFVIPSGT